MINNKILNLVILLFLGTSGIASETENYDVYPKAKPIVKVFGNYHFGLNEFSTDNAFEVTRAYLGYDVKMSEYFSFKTNLDIGKPSDDSKYDYVAFLKIAELKYHKEKLTIHAGLIGLKQFKVQEEYWGYRYIYKSFQDEHKFGSSADLGIMLEYEIVDNLLMDATIRNGEGYKKNQSDNTYNASLGLTYNIGENFTIRGYYEYAEKTVNQSLYSGFVGYKLTNILSIGAEYNFMQNSSFNEHKDMIGYSTYLTYILNEKFQLFGRYDNLTSNNAEGETEVWNILKDGQAIIVGIQYKLEKNIKLSTNLQYWSPSKTDSDDEVYVFVSLEYKL